MVIQSPTGKALARIAKLERELATLREEFAMTPTAQAAPEFMTLREVADLTSRSYRTVERWVENGLLEVADRAPFRGGGLILVRRVDALALAESPLKPGPKRRAIAPSQ